PWPAEIVNTVTFAEDEGRTTITLRAVPIRATEEEIRVFIAGFDSMAQGYGGTFERLAEVLE
ncbi:MAG TPA: SRPBCC domain-containing protein, partial [Paenibacillus sp.]|nr:SRPBCC domain-containing protein [Paenibacillus sp.]